MRNCFYWDFTTRHRILASWENQRITSSVLLNILHLKNLPFTVIRHEKDIVVHCCSTCEIWGFSSHFDERSSLMGYDIVLTGRYLFQRNLRLLSSASGSIWLFIHGIMSQTTWVLTVVLIKKFIFELISYLEKKPP